MQSIVRRIRTIGNFENAGGLFVPAAGVDLARSFNGTSDLITLPYGVTDALANGSAMSMACWFKGSAAQSDIRLQSDGTTYAILNWTGGGAGAGSCIMSNDGGTGSGLSWSSAVVDGNWHQVAMIWGQNATFAIYLDGVLVTSRAAANTALPNFPHTFQPALGSYDAGLGEFMNGSLADIAVWNAVLTPTQLSNLAAGQRANTIGANANLVGGYWPILGQSPEPDKSGNAFNGVLTGTTIVAGPPSLQPF
jgi:Concanavalin A-like lectin/glucanases superfamily